MTSNESTSLDYYGILRVTRTASADEIREAYREIAKAYHPDSNFYDEIIKEIAPQRELEGKFKELTTAYQTLINPERRAAYDATLPPLVDTPPDSKASGKSEALRPSRTHNTGVFARKPKAKNNQTVVMPRGMKARFGQTSAKLKRDLSVRMESVGELLGITNGGSSDPLMGLSPLIIALGLITCMALGALLVVLLRAAF